MKKALLITLLGTQILFAQKDLDRVIKYKCLVCHMTPASPGKLNFRKPLSELDSLQLNKIRDRVLIKQDMPQGNKLNQKELAILKGWLDQVSPVPATTDPKSP